MVVAEKGEILQNGFPPDLAIAHLELARVYLQMNNRDLARNHYGEALRMWQHADESIQFREGQRGLRELAPEVSPSGKTVSSATTKPVSQPQTK